MSWMGLTNAEEMLYEQLKSNINHSNKKGIHNSDSSLLDYSDYDDNESNISQVDISEYQNIKTGGVNMSHNNNNTLNTNDKFAQYQAKSPNTNTNEDS